MDELREINDLLALARAQDHTVADFAEELWKEFLEDVQGAREWRRCLEEVLTVQGRKEPALAAREAVFVDQARKKLRQGLLSLLEWAAAREEDACRDPYPGPDE